MFSRLLHHHDVEGFNKGSIGTPFSKKKLIFWQLFHSSGFKGLNSVLSWLSFQYRWETLNLNEHRLFNNSLLRYFNKCVCELVRGTDSRCSSHTLGYYIETWATSERLKKSFSVECYRAAFWWTQQHRQQFISPQQFSSLRQLHFL